VEKVIKNNDKTKFIETIKQIIKGESFTNFEKVIKSDKLSHAYLITFEDEFYNEQFCIAVAITLACGKSQPCFKCNNCLKIISQFHPDVFTYPQNQTFLVDDSISIIRNASIKPMLINYKIFIINNVDKSTIQAQNKILKTLEDTPKNVIFLLNTTDLNNVLQTIISRTLSISLKPLKSESVAQILKAITGKVDYTAINLGDGLPGKTLSLTNQKIAAEYDFILSMLSEMKNTKLIINYINKFSEKSGFLNRLNILQDVMDKLLHANFSSSNDEKIQSLVKDFNVETIYGILNLIVESKKQFEANVNPNLIADYLLFKILEVKYLCNIKK
jgi:DNA polymerase-3 subunit delta'